LNRTSTSQLHKIALNKFNFFKNPIYLCIMSRAHQSHRVNIDCNDCMRTLVKCKRLRISEFYLLSNTLQIEWHYLQPVQLLLVCYEQWTDKLTPQKASITTFLKHRFAICSAIFSGVTEYHPSKSTPGELRICSGSNKDKKKHQTCTLKHINHSKYLGPLQCLGQILKRANNADSSIF
jgi:hypothetical protein